MNDSTRHDAAIVINGCNLDEFLHGEWGQRLIVRFDSKPISPAHSDGLVFESPGKAVYLLDEPAFLEFKDAVFSTDKDITLILFNNGDSLKAITRSYLTERRVPLIKLLEFKPSNEYGKSLMEFRLNDFHEQYSWIRDLAGDIAKGLLVELIVKIILG